MKKLSVVFLIVVLIFSITACGGSSSYNGAYPQEAPSYSGGSGYFGDAMMSDMAATNSAGFNGFFSNTNKSESYVDYVDMDSGFTYDETGAVDSGYAEQKLVYTSNISLETKNMESALNIIYDMISQYDGIIQNEDLSNINSIYMDPEYYYDGYRQKGSSGTIFVRIPQKNYDSFINGLYSENEMLFVNSAAKSIDNMTEVYYDTETRLRTLRTEQERLYEFMESATTVQEMLSIEDRLSEVQYQIESATNRLKTIDNDVAYAKVTLYIKEVLKYSDKPILRDTFLERLAFYFKDSGSEFVEFLEDLVELLIYVVPYLVLLGLVLFVFLKLQRKWREKHPKKEKPKKSRRMKLGNGRVILVDSLDDNINRIIEKDEEEKEDTK